jgi:hypothetical protein
LEPPTWFQPAEAPSPRRVVAFKPSAIAKQRINAAKGAQADEVRMLA